MNLKFRRQHPVGRYVADFHCAEASLIVELDGLSHDGRGTYDDQRTAEIEREGLYVLRVTNDDLLEHCEAVAEHIAATAREQFARSRQVSTPSPSEGEGRGEGVAPREPDPLEELNRREAPHAQSGATPTPASNPHPNPLPKRERE